MQPYLIRAHQILTMTGWDDKPLFSASPDALEARDRHITGAIDDGVVAVDGEGRVAWVGTWAECPHRDDGLVMRDVGLVTPAWVECHTHSLFAGLRAGEFALRNAGTPYVDILEAGGGILSTVDATRAASDSHLVAHLVARLEAFAARGVGRVEVKTGYGLAHDEELRHLRLIQEAASQTRVKVMVTWLGAHAVPREYRDQRERYVDALIAESLPAVVEQGIADFADVFCDRGAFTVGEAERILSRARDAGLGLRIHAEEITHTGSAQVAAALGALSVDHCDHIDDAGIAALARHGSTAVLLPGVTLFLDLEQRPPARRLIDSGVSVALSTDYNPGSCHTQELALMTSLGCTMLKMTPGESLWAVTAGAARSLGVAHEAGSIAVGRAADLCLFSAPSDYRTLPYLFGAPSFPELLLDGR